jgi:hypothetical protein
LGSKDLCAPLTLRLATLTPVFAVAVSLDDGLGPIKGRGGILVPVQSLGRRIGTVRAVRVVAVAAAALVGLAGHATSAVAQGWTQSDALTSAAAPGTSPTGFAFGGGAARIYFVAAADGQIHSLDYNPRPGGCRARR